MGANAQTSVPAFTAGQVLTAAQVTQINTGIPVFASSTERDAAFGGTGEKTLAEGQMAYLEDTNETQYYDGSSWAAVGQAGGKVLQVVSATKTDVFSTASSTLVDITGLSVSITPTDATSTILVHYVANASNNGVSDGGAVQLVRDSTAIFESTAGSTNFSSAFTKQVDTALIWAFSGMHLDSPATTSATTYKLQARRLGSNNFLLNRPGATTTYGVASSITVMEIAA